MLRTPVRSFRTMASPFTNAVVASMRALYPESLADKSFDNTGLLLEAPANLKLKHSVLLTIDLTTQVTDEAIERECSIVVAYHPIIFRPLKSMTLGDTQQSSLLRLAAKGISVYCPHTAVDAQEGGNADWLADIVVGKPQPKIDASTTLERHQILGHEPNPTRYRNHHFPSLLNWPTTNFSATQISHTRSVIKPISGNSNSAQGMGRIVNFDQPRFLDTVIENVAGALGYPKALSIAIPPAWSEGSNEDPPNIRNVAICAGSGGSLLMPLIADVDLLLTGEMSHHEALAATQRGCAVLCTNHSNSERGFLHSVMRPKLLEALQKEWRESADVEISQRDRDPFSALVHS